MGGAPAHHIALLDEFAPLRPNFRYARIGTIAHASYSAARLGYGSGANAAITMHLLRRRRRDVPARGVTVVTDT
jgi:hypothetical protein